MVDESLMEAAPTHVSIVAGPTVWMESEGVVMSI